MSGPLGLARRFGLGLAMGLLGLLLFGCGPSFQWNGHWTGKRNLPLPEGGDPAILSTISKVELTLEPNGRFELLEGGLPKSGTFHAEGQTAYLKITHFMDRPIEAQGEAAVKMNQEIVLTAQKDGSVLFDDPGGIAKETVRLTRAETSPQR